MLESYSIGFFQNKSRGIQSNLLWFSYGKIQDQGSVFKLIGAKISLMNNMNTYGGLFLEITILGMQFLSIASPQLYIDPHLTAHAVFYKCSFCLLLVLMSSTYTLWKKWEELQLRCIVCVCVACRWSQVQCPSSKFSGAKRCERPWGASTSPSDLGGPGGHLVYFVGGGLSEKGIDLAEEPTWCLGQNVGIDPDSVSGSAVRSWIWQSWFWHEKWCWPSV